MPVLYVVVVSTRPGRVGPVIANWAVEAAKKHGAFEVELVDLAEIALPMYDEANHPRLRQYEHEHTKAWSALISKADAFVLVTPEYNYGTPPSLVNALDYLATEWAYKPVAFVSYGGVSAGTRSVQMTKQIVTTLKMMPLPEAVNIPFFAQHLSADKTKFEANAIQEQAAIAMLTELRRWTDAMKVLRS